VIALAGVARLELYRVRWCERTFLSQLLVIVLVALAFLSREGSPAADIVGFPDVLIERRAALFGVN
jgi:hypothetical protein